MQVEKEDRDFNDHEVVITNGESFMDESVSQKENDD